MNEKEKQEKYADLHNHTTASDGLLTPVELVQFALKKGLSAIAITDHDSTEAIEVALNAGRKYNLEVIPGIELNTRYVNTEVHILGYYINNNKQWLQDILRKIRESRYNRAEKIISNLKRIHNIDITFEEVLDVADGGKNSAISRPHIAKVLIQKGIVNNNAEAFEKYIGVHCDAYEDRYMLGPEEAIEIIKRAQGVPVLAHPGLLGNDAMVLELISKGIKGIEAFHSKHTEQQNHKYKEMASAHNIIATGGSDCHGELTDGLPIVGDIKVEYRVVEALKEAAEYNAKK